MDNKGYYKTLGVAENATDDEIRSKYKKLALQWHPDRWVNGTDEEKKTAEDKFKQLNEAYSVLSDKQKRQQYDSGMEGNWQNMGGFDPFEFFRQHFSGTSFTGGFPGFDFGGWDSEGNFQSKPVSRGADIDVNLTLTMAEANSGVSKTITYEMHDKCPECNGTGVGPGGKVETCPHCHGTGQLKNVQKVGFAQIVTQTQCPYCGGKGKTIKNPCLKCNGTGISDKTRTETITITTPVGIAPGETLVVQGFGEYPRGGDGQRGDLKIHVSLLMPDGYSFMNNMGGVIYNMEVPFYDAMLGFEKEVLFPSGQTKKVKIDKGTKNGHVYSFRNEGMKLKDGQVWSSFDVKIIHKTPDKINKKQEEILKEFKKVTENGY